MEVVDSFANTVVSGNHAVVLIWYQINAVSTFSLAISWLIKKENYFGHIYLFLYALKYLYWLSSDTTLVWTGPKKNSISI